MPLHLNEQELSARFALLRVPGIGPSAHATLLAHYHEASQVFLASEADLINCGLKPKVAQALKAQSLDSAKPDLQWLEGENRHVLAPQSQRYPLLLQRIARPPPLLYVQGDLDALSHPQLAIVGSRNPSPGGRENAHEFARHLAGAGLGITSGLASGIDAAAHEGALQAEGYTVAVTATGLDRVYPPQHRELAHRIASQGALVSEFPIGTVPKPENFPQRNRIISGLSLGTLVVEAAIRSGSLITARSANEQGREVFAIPGSIHNPLARGCHRLIREGAKLVETAQDILEELAPVLSTGLPSGGGSQPPAPTAEPELGATYEHMLSCMGYDPTPIDTLVERSGLTPDAVSSMLLILELQDQVALVKGGCYVRLKPRE